MAEIKEGRGKSIGAKPCGAAARRGVRGKARGTLQFTDRARTSSRLPGCKCGDLLRRHPRQGLSATKDRQACHLDWRRATVRGLGKNIGADRENTDLSNNGRPATGTV